MANIYRPPITTSAILVLGNGFDLSCGLSTKYSDFFEYYVVPNILQDPTHISLYSDENVTTGDDVGKIIANLDDVSLWEYYLASKLPKKDQYDKKDWFNIEQLIADSFETGGHWNIIKDYFKRPYPASGYDKKHFERDGKIRKVLYDALYYRYKDRILDEVGNLINKEFYNVLLLELNKLEAHFGKYIKLLITNNSDYATKKKNKLDLITNKLQEVLAKDYKAPINLHLQIISFNYTQTPNDGITYIHGTYANPIFGIDNLEYIDPDLYIFDKTVRRGQAKTIDQYWSTLANKKFDLAFYGTSFGSSDYPEYEFLKNKYAKENGPIVVLYSNFDEKERYGDTRKACAPVLQRLFNLPTIASAYNLGASEHVFIEKVD